MDLNVMVMGVEEIKKLEAILE